MALQFQRLSGTPFRRAFQEAVSELEAITSADKGSAVPLLQIHQINLDGTPVYAGDDHSVPKRPLMSQAVTPPEFGSSLKSGVVFGERPEYSFENMKIKVMNPRGLICYRQLEINFVAHRPDPIFANDPNRDVDDWSDLLIPGYIFQVQYGWTSSGNVKNRILNGDGVSQAAGKSSDSVPIPAFETFRILITNYSFKIQQNGEIRFTVQALEDGEQIMRRAHIFHLDDPLDSSLAGKDAVSGTGGNLAQQAAKRPKNLYADPGILKKLLDDMRKRLVTTKKAGKKYDAQISLSDVFNIVFAPPLETTFIKSLGYGKLDLYLGDFNKRAGSPAPGFSKGSEWIGDLAIPFERIEELLKELVKLGETLTFQNTITRFFEIVNDAQTWSREDGAVSDQFGSLYQTPQLGMRVRTAKDQSGKLQAVIVVFDVKNDYIQLTGNDPDFAATWLGTDATPEQVRNRLAHLQIPIISFTNGNSYIAEAPFNVTYDDQMRSIFIRRGFDQNQPRWEQINTPTGGVKKNAPAPEEFMYSSAIMGELVMLGNHVFDVFSTVWIDFGVRQWSGPFSVMEREDMISAGDFKTHIRLRAIGTDPLGTQGRNLGPSAEDAQNRGIISSPTPVGGTGIF